MLSDNDETFELRAAVAAVFLHGILDARERKASRRRLGCREIGHCKLHLLISSAN